MKFGKNLLSVVELSDPEWGPFWMNYKMLKKKINDIVVEQGGAAKEIERSQVSTTFIAKSPAEVEFFRFLMHELKKTSDFFDSSEHLYKIRKTRLLDGLHLLQEKDKRHDKNTWTRLLMACVRFYKDVLLLENYAIMHFCGISKILKKHDKMTGYCTRDAFMQKVMRSQNFVNYPYVMELLKESEKLFEEIQSMESVMPLQDEERLFIEAIRDLNYQASRLQAEENETTEALAKKKRLEQESSLLKGEKGDGGDADAIHRSIAEAALKAKNAFDKMPCSSPAGLSQNLSWMQENLQKIQSSNMQFNNNVSSSDEEENVPKKMKLEV